MHICIKVETAASSVCDVCHSTVTGVRVTDMQWLQTSTKSKAT